MLNVFLFRRDLLGIMVRPLDLHLVIVGPIPTGPTSGERRLQPHPWDELQPTPNVRKSRRTGLNLEGRLSDPQKLNVVLYERLVLSLHFPVTGCTLNHANKQRVMRYVTSL